MAKSPSITHVAFHPPNDASLPVELLSIEELQQRAPTEHFENLQRADFFRLIGVCEGVTRPMVDFSIYEATTGDWLLVRPGQVFRYDFSRPWRGWLLVFRPDSFLATRPSHAQEKFDLAQRMEELPCLHVLRPEQHAGMTRGVEQMAHDAGLRVEPSLRNELLRLALAAMLMRLSLWQSPTTGLTTNPRSRSHQFSRFRQLLEADFTTRHQVQHYANRLGMSEKTLSRVCMSTVGVSAKTLINRRLVLEAKRLLAHTATAVQTMGRDLGFEEATNFVKFFRKETQMTPLEFRKTQLFAQMDKA